jgi:hypothetical protein
VHDAVVAAWDKLAEDWDNQARHDALRALAVEHGELKWLATKYREKQGDPVAVAQLGKITSAAMATMLARETAAKSDGDVNAPYKRAAMWIVVLLIMLLLGLIAAKLVTGVHHHAAG